MAAQQILLNKPARALPVGAEIDGNAVVNDDGERRSDDRAWMRAGAIGSAEQVIEPSLDHHTGPVIFGELQKLLAEAFPVANDRVDEVLSGLAFNRNLMLQTGEGVVPRR